MSEAKALEAEHLNNDAIMKAQLQSYNLEIEQLKVFICFFEIKILHETLKFI
jgi:hypothetical protein